MADLEKLDNAIKELEIQSNDLKDFNKVYSEIGKLKDGISNNLSLLKENNDGFSTISTEVKSRLEESKKQIESLESELLKKIQELYQDNKNFQKELDASLITRLDKHKSDIQVEVRNEGTQIQRGFETTLNTNFNSMESKLKELFDVQSKQLNMLKILMFVTIGIGIGLAIGLYLK
jgi:flagellar biosynthesis/type III secretory pathway protein FliH